MSEQEEPRCLAVAATSTIIIMNTIETATKPLMVSSYKAVEQIVKY